MSVFISELVAFVLIIVFIARVIWPRVRDPLAKRQTEVAQQVRDAEEAKNRLGEAERAFQNAVTEARTEAAQIRENARAEAQRTVEDQKASAEQEYERIVARGEEQLHSQRAALVRDLRSEIGTLAIVLAEQIVEQRLADQEHLSATVDSFLAGLETHQPERGVGA